MIDHKASTAEQKDFDSKADVLIYVAAATRIQTAAKKNLSDKGDRIVAAQIAVSGIYAVAVVALETPIPSCPPFAQFTLYPSDFSFIPPAYQQPRRLQVCPGNSRLSHSVASIPCIGINIASDPQLGRPETCSVVQLRGRSFGRPQHDSKTLTLSTRLDSASSDRLYSFIDWLQIRDREQSAVGPAWLSQTQVRSLHPAPTTALAVARTVPSSRPPSLPLTFSGSRTCDAG
nr:hypothetical protein CFP56_25990 [Quercus suber]